MTAVDPAIGALEILDPFDLGVAGLLDQVRKGSQQLLLAQAPGGVEKALDELDVLPGHATSLAPGAVVRADFYALPSSTTT